MSSFIPETQGYVTMTSLGGPVRLSPESVEQMLAIFDRERAVRQSNALHDAYVAAGGIPVTSSLRAA